MVGFSIDEELEHLHLNPARKGLVELPEDWSWSNDNLFAGEKATIAGSPLRLTARGCRNGIGREKISRSGLQ